MDSRITASLGVLGGIIVGGLAVFAGESVLHSMVSTPGQSTSMFGGLVLIYGLAALVAGYVTNLICRNIKYKPALLAGIGLAVTTVLNFMEVGGHPTWVWIASILVTLGGAWLGGRLSAGRV